MLYALALYAVNTQGSVLLQSHQLKHGQVQTWIVEETPEMIAAR
jgi:hypothetical protein